MESTEGNRGGGGPSSIDRLLAAVRGGVPAARDRLCRRILPAFRRWASRRLPPSARGMIDTDDLVQETMMRTIDRLEELSVDGPGMLAYLRAAARNRVRDEVKRAARLDREALQAAHRDSEAFASPLRRVLGSEAVEQYEAALERLASRERAAVILRVEMDMKFAEIAELLEWSSVDAARMAVSRSIRRLAREMADGPI
jgi:RNA polymerase sigma factor (sigma-70 family)